MKNTAERFIQELRESGAVPDAELFEKEFEYSVVQADETALDRRLYLSVGTARLLSAVNKLNARRLAKRIAQELGWEGPPPDLLHDANLFLKTFNRWREQADYDFVAESSPGPVYDVTLTEKWRKGRDEDRDHYRENCIEARARTLLEAGCRVWLGALIRRRREKKSRDNRPG